MYTFHTAYAIFPIGAPVQLPDSILRAKLASADSEAREQHLRNPRSYDTSHLDQIPDPDADFTQDENSSMANLEICKLLPHLGNVPEDTLKRLPLAAIFQLSNALAKSSKASDKLSLNSKLALNAQNLLKMPSKVLAGEDNRRNILHEARFLGGACCSTNDIWTIGCIKFLRCKSTYILWSGGVCRLVFGIRNIFKIIPGAALI